MFGTIALLRLKPGQEQAVLALFDRWYRERRPHVTGFVAEYVYRNNSNPSELLAAMIFDGPESYFAYVNAPEQDWLYREMVELLESEPHWIDGEIIGSWTA